MNPYRVCRDGEVMGVYRKQGETIILTDAQARHLTAPLGSVIEPVLSIDRDKGRRNGGSMAGRGRRRGSADG